MNDEIIDQLKSILNLYSSESKKGWLTLKDVCEYTKLSSSTIYRSIRRGELKVSKKTGKNLFRKEWVDQFLGE